MDGIPGYKGHHDLWMPTHFKRICSAIDQLPSNLDFDDPSLPGTGLSQNLESHYLSQSHADSASPPVEQNSQSSNARQEGITPSTSFTDPETTKRRKGKKQWSFRFPHGVGKSMLVV